MKETQNTKIPLAFSYLTDPNRLIKSLGISNHVLRGKKRAHEKKDLREVHDSMRIIGSLFASNQKFAIKMKINGSTTKDLGGIPASFRAENEKYVFNQIHALQKKEFFPRFKEFKRFLNLRTAKKNHDAVRLFFARQEKESDTIFKELMKPSDTIKTNKALEFANKVPATKGTEVTQGSPDIKRVMEAPDIRRHLERALQQALLKASILINAIGRKTSFGTTREAGGTQEQR